jgi:hypothetical protein
VVVGYVAQGSEKNAAFIISVGALHINKIAFMVL